MLHAVDRAGDVLPGVGRHFARFYDEDAALLEEVAEFIDVALRAGGVGIVIATPDHAAELRRRLGGLGSMPGRPSWFSGELIVLDAAETLERLMDGDRPDARRFEAIVGTLIADARAGGRTVHAFGEMVALLCEQGLHDAAIGLEQLWNRLAARHVFALFCGYPWRAFPTADHASAFRHVCAEHDDAGSHAHRLVARPAREVRRRVVELEQRARSLQAEVERRKAAEETLRRREKEFTDFVENAAEGLHRVGPDGRILWANAAELQMLGYTWDDYVGRHIAEFHVDRPVIERIMARLKSGETLYDQPARLRCRDGSVKHVRVHSNACFDGERLLYTRCFTRDATERRERDDALARLERSHAERERLVEELCAANRAKDEFLAMLGHELRNPLSPIVTALQLMRMRGETGTSREQGIIQRQVEHLVRLVDDLLDISRVTRGKIELKVQRVALSQVLTKAVEMASLLLEQRSHRLSLDIEPDLEWEGDPVRLAQVVANLLTNAARYTDTGGSIRLRAQRDGEDGLCIGVEDNGTGIAADMLPRVFDLFFQGKRSLDRSEGGLGIGLALVKNIVALHGGRVEARSAGKGLGSEFVVRLPLRSVRGADAAAADDANATEPPQTARERRRVMLVDDNADGAEALGRLLAASGHRVEVFGDAASALDALRRFEPEVAILDIGLPVLDGYELAARIRALPEGRACRLIALTGYGLDTDRARSAAAGFDLHLVKPVDPEQLLRLVDAAAGARETLGSA